MTNPIIEINTFEQNWIEVIYEIDYRKKQISILEDNLTPKKYIFAKRWPEYMKGWRDILETIKNAITEAEIKLKEHIEKLKQEEKEKLVHILDI